MDIVVCVKQTPAPAEARIDPVTKTLVREGVALVLSSLDRRALLEALRLRNEVGGTLKVLTMGPPQAKSALQECLALGADEGILLTDRAFAGADTLATSRAIATAIKKLSADLVVCGRFSIDSETSQVPSEIAEFLGLPQVTSARKIRPTDTKDSLWVERETDEGYEQYEVRLPALLSVTELIIPGRRPSQEETEAGTKKPIAVWSATDIGGDASKFGAAGSPTRVAELRSAALERKGEVVSGLSPRESAARLAAYLFKNGIFQPRSKDTMRNPRRPLTAERDGGRAVWVVSELIEGRVRPVGYELLGAAQDVADVLGGEVASLLVGGLKLDEHVRSLGAFGADRVYVASHELLAKYDTLRYTDIVVSAIKQYRPYVVIFPSTTNGRDLAPRVAARLEVGLTGDAIGVEIDGKGEIAMLKPAFGGNIVAPIYSKTVPVMATVRPGMLTAREPDWRVSPRTVELRLSLKKDSQVRLLESAVQPDLGAVNLDDADVVVTVGMGVGGPENLPIIRELASAVKGTLAATLRVATAGWIPPQLQLGLTGKAVAPRFYFAIGVSGQPNHLVGTKKAEHIIAVNNDPKAPIFQSANFGVVGDWKEIVPALTRELLAEGRPR